MNKKKQVNFMLKSIEYTGDNIGRDLFMSFSTLGITTQFKKKIVHGSTAKVNFEITECFVIHGDEKIPLHIRLVEEDDVFDDFGELKTVISIDYNSLDKQIHKREVKVYGDTVGDRKAVAKFILVFETQLTNLGVRYVSDVAKGWLTVIVDDIGNWNLPNQLKVDLTKIYNNREYFTILEGRLKNKTASVKLRENGKSYLVEQAQRTKAAKLEYSRANKILKILGTTKEYWAVLAEIGEIPPIPNGTYSLEIPYEPHHGGSYYLRYSTRAKTWFRIGHTSDYGNRFLHVGNTSHGCITVRQHDRWDEIYNYLITAREGSFSVGTISIKD